MSINKEKYKNAEELVKFLKIYTQRYLDWFREALKVIEKRIREDADLIVDGMKPISESAEIVVSKIQEFLESS